MTAAKMTHHSGIQAENAGFVIRRVSSRQWRLDLLHSLPGLLPLVLCQEIGHPNILVVRVLVTLNSCR